MENTNDTEIDVIGNVIERLIALKQSTTITQTTFTELECKYIITKSIPIFTSESSMLELSAPLLICGDIHGQYYDLLHVFEILGYPPQRRYLFLGDYVDRGKQSLETLLLLLCLKIKYPTHIYLLRGNHESESVNRMYGFFDECKRKVSIRIHKQFSTVFNLLPITAVIDNKILCMHGGLSKELETLDQLQQIQRPTEIPDSGLLCDLVWSDPCDDESVEWGESERGVSFTFSRKVVDRFVKKNELDLICRAHQVVEEGYEFFSEMNLVTVFTAPNYMGEFDNNGGILEVNEDLLCKFHIIRPIRERGKKERKKIKKYIN